jgi:hypothetical protein
MDDTDVTFQWEEINCKSLSRDLMIANSVTSSHQQASNMSCLERKRWMELKLEWVNKLSNLLKMTVLWDIVLCSLVEVD